MKIMLPVMFCASAALANQQIAQHVDKVTAATKVNQRFLEAVQGEKFSLVKYLLETLGADSSFVDEQGKRAGHYAALNGDVRMLTLLSEAGSPFNLADKDGNFPLHFAVQNEHDDAIIHLVDELEVDVNAFISWLVKEVGTDTSVRDVEGKSAYDLYVHLNIKIDWNIARLLKGE